MVKELAAARIKRGRGMILEALIAWDGVSTGRYAGPVDRVALRSALDIFGMHMTVDELQKELDYLEERGYVQTEQRSLGGHNVVLVEITASGRDVVDRITPDHTILTDD